MPTRVFVGKLPDSTTEDSFLELFSKYGEVVKTDLKDGYGFIFFENEDEALDAIKNLDGAEFEGNHLVVENARGPKEFKQKPIKRYDLRISVSGLDPRTSWQDLKDWARQAGDVTFTNVYARDGHSTGVIEYQDEDGLENALRTLEDVPLRGVHVRLEKADQNGGGDYYPPSRRGGDFREGGRSGFNNMGRGGGRGGYNDFRSGGPRGMRDSRDRGYTNRGYPSEGGSRGYDKGYDRGYGGGGPRGPSDYDRPPQGFRGGDYGPPPGHSNDYPPRGGYDRGMGAPPVRSELILLY